MLESTIVKRNNIHSISFAVQFLKELIIITFIFFRIHENVEYDEH